MRRGKQGERDRFREPESTPGRHSLTPYIYIYMCIYIYIYTLSLLFFNHIIHICTCVYDVDVSMRVTVCPKAQTNKTAKDEESQHQPSCAGLGSWKPELLNPVLRGFGFRVQAGLLGCKIRWVSALGFPEEAESLHAELQHTRVTGPPRSSRLERRSFLRVFDRAWGVCHFWVERLEFHDSGLALLQRFEFRAS